MPGQKQLLKEQFKPKQEWETIFNKMTSNLMPNSPLPMSPYRTGKNSSTYVISNSDSNKTIHQDEKDCISATQNIETFIYSVYRNFNK